LFFYTFEPEKTILCVILFIYSSCRGYWPHATGNRGGVIRDQVIAAVSVISRDSPMYGCDRARMYDKNHPP